jgi:GDPmannose 4,6-dehydratase
MIRLVKALGRVMAGRTAVVTGAAGQDGHLLVERLLAEGCTVHGVVRDRSRAADLESLPGADRLTIHEIDITDTAGCRALLAAVRPDELYNLAGLSSVRQSFDRPSEAWRTNADAVVGLLEAVRTESSETRFYQASSTDMFGASPGESTIHDEWSAFRPQSPYAAAKAAAHLACQAHRTAFGLRIACGILSNHESARRPASFLTAKVIAHLRALRDAEAGDAGRGAGADGALRVGNLAVRREWGFAPDYVDGMIRICRQVAVRAEIARTTPDPDIGASYRDYVLGTGRQTAVWELVDRAFALAGSPLEWARASADPRDWVARDLATGNIAVVVDPAFVRPAEPATIGTDPSRARRELGWLPRTDVNALLGELLERAEIAPAPTAAG